MSWLTLEIERVIVEVPAPADETAEYFNGEPVNVTPLTWHLIDGKILHIKLEVHDP